EAVGKDSLRGGCSESLKAVESGELPPQRSDFQERWRRVVKRILGAPNSSRVVLMFNALAAGL
ncbi:MAG: hypothetical protein LM590_09285, partial [Thermofilum sp.]|nr:hypothetical protein [Thermofilum sp.]